MTVTRGYTEEADKLLDYLVSPASVCVHTPFDTILLQEKGIFDALQHRYLRSFIFAIYLVSLSSSTLFQSSD